jgi:hypothetical protein
MTQPKSVNPLILENIRKAQNQEILINEIYSNLNIQTGQNEFLFFIKPEITRKSETIQYEKILNLIFDRIEFFKFNIHNIKILSAKYLEQYNIIGQHYGVINKISSDAFGNISESAKLKFKELYGKSIHDAHILGGLELLKQFPNLNAYSLGYLWQNVENNKLASGTYCAPIKIDNEVFYLFNGFHPSQLKHFTEQGRSVVIMSLSSNLSWADARNNFIGSTNPIIAKEGSLRRVLLDMKNDLGLFDVSQSFNGVHLSAGPVEALVELRRFNSNFTINNGIKEYSYFNFGRLLLDTFKSQFNDIVNNAKVSLDGKETSVFDLTEEKDSDESIILLKKALFKV